MITEFQFEIEYILSILYNKTEFQFEIEYISSMKYDYDKTGLLPYCHHVGLQRDQQDWVWPVHHQGREVCRWFEQNIMINHICLTP